tara:strand:- start:16 stop:1260 length:1245 start_codon:yes stop_codon:yes gene_type:complete
VIQILKKKTSEKVGFKIENLGNCVQLSNTILEVNDEFLSYNTIRRFYGLVKSPKKTSKKTLDILARYNGYHDYSHFTKSFKFENKWKLQNDLYEQMHDGNSKEIVLFVKKTLRYQNDHIGIIIQIIRELLILKKYEIITDIFELKELNFNKLTYDEITHIGNGLGLLLRTIAIEKSIIQKLISIKNYQDLVLTMFVDYSHLNGYYYDHIKALESTKTLPHLTAFKKCLSNLIHYLNKEKLPVNEVSIKSDFHPILKSRIMAQKMLYDEPYLIKSLNNYVNTELLSLLPIEYFYELIITAMITKNYNAMEWIIEQVERNNTEKYIYHIRHLQHFYLMKSMFYASKNNKSLYLNAKNQFSLETASTSYKELLKVFVIMGEYHFAKEKDKILFRIEYKKLTKKLGYSLFDDSYLELV